MIIGHQLLSGALENIPSVFNDIGPIAHGQRLSDILFHQKDGDALLIYFFD